MPRLASTIALSLAFATPALAEIESVTADGPVPEVMDRLEAAVTEAGATVFARVDHAAGAESVEMELTPSQLLIFGNPKLGTLPMQQDIRAGLYLPLKMLVYRDGEETRIAWEQPEEMFDDLDIDDDAEFIGKMGQALEGLAQKASAGQ